MDGETPSRLGRALHVSRRAVAVAVITVLVVILAVVFTLHQLLRSESFAGWVLDQAMPRVNAALPGEVRFSSFRGALGTELQLHDIEIIDERGVIAARVKELGLTWDALDLLARRVDVDALRVVDPVVYVRIRDDGTLNFKEAFVAPGGKPKEPKEGPVTLPVTFDVRAIDLSGGHVEVLIGDGEPTVVVDQLVVQGAWSMRDLDQDFSLTRVDAHLMRPVDPGPISARGSGTLKVTDLTLDAFVVDWGDDRVVIGGAWPQVGKGVAALEVGVERLDLAHLKVFSEAIPLAGVVTGALQVDGALSDLHVKGGLDVEGGGRLTLNDAAVRLVSGEPLGHLLDADLDAFPLRSVVTIDALPTELTGHVGWEGAGTKLPTLAGEASVDLLGFHYRGFHVEPTRLRAGIADSKVQVDELVTGADGLALRTAGDVDLEAGRFTLDTEAQVSDLSGIGRALKLPLKGGRVTLSGRQVGDWKAPGSPFILNTDSTISGRVVGVAGLAFDGIDGDWTLEVALKPGRLPSINGSVRFVATEMTLGKLAFDTVSVDAVGNDRSAIFEVIGRAGEGRGFSTNGRVDWSKTPAIRLDVDTLALDFDGERVTGGAFRFDADRGRLSITPASFDLHPGTLDVGGAWDPRGSMDLTATLAGFDLPRVERFLPQPLNLEGDIKSVRVALLGSRAAPEVRLAIDADGLGAKGKGPFGLRASIEALPAGITGDIGIPGLLDVKIGRIPAALQLMGGRPFTVEADTDWDVVAELPRVALTDWTDRLGVLLPSAADGGEISGVLRVAGTTRDPHVELDVDVASLRLADRNVHLSAGATLQDRRLTVRDTHIREASAGTVFSLTASTVSAVGEQLVARLDPSSEPPPPWLSELRMEGGFRRLPLEIVHAAVPALRPLQGVLKGSVTMEGELADPRLGLDLALLGGTLGAQSLRTAELGLKLDAGLLEGGLVVRPESGGQLVVTPRAKIPLALDGSRTVEEMLGRPESLSVTVRGDGFPLAVPLGFVPGILESEGAMRLQGKVTGSVLRPEPEIDLELVDSRVCYSKTSICYENIALRADFTPRRLRLEELDFDTLPIIRNPLDALRPVDEARAGGLKGSGRIALEGWKLGRFDLELTGEKTWLIYTDEVQALVDTSLSVKGPWPDLGVTGTVDVRDLKVDMGSQDVQRKVQPMVLPDTLRVHRTESRRGPGERDLRRLVRLAEAEREPTLFERLKIDVLVDLGVNNRVKLAYGVGEALASGSDDQAGKVAARSIDLIGKIEPDIRPKGTLRVVVEGGVPRLQGRLGVQTNSKLKVLTAKFLLDTDSHAEFGGEITDTALDLRAVHTSRFGDIAVLVTGSLAAPSIAFESDAFDSQADMLAVLLTGRPLSEHSAAEGNATARAVSGALSGFTTRLLDKVVPLDIFQVDLGDDISSGSVEAGKAIGPRVVLITRWTWGGEDDENRVEAEVEVLLARGFYFQTRFGDRAEGSVDLVYKERF